jgi:hypothetical protein
MLEINKGGTFEYSDVYASVIDIRKKMGLIESLDTYVIDDRYSKVVDKEIEKMISNGYITQRFNGMAIKDARALANASIYVYNVFAKEFNWFLDDIKDVIKIALTVSSNVSEYKYDYYLNKGIERENYDYYYKLYTNMKLQHMNVNSHIMKYIGDFSFSLGYRAIDNYVGYYKIINIANSIIEGEDLDDIAYHLGVSLDEVVNVREKIIDIYNNERKSVESKNKK